MNTSEEKVRLLKEMIAFSAVNGKLSKKDYDFLFLISNKLEFERGVFIELFNQELPKLPLRNEFQRIQQFYRLALIMYREELLDLDEAIGIQQIAIGMGLNTDATKRILKRMKKDPDSIIPPEALLKIFNEERV